MANVKISALPAATTVASADVLPIVQSATTKKATFQVLSDALGVTSTVANASPGLVYITSQNIGSAVSSVSLNNCFSSAYDNYKVIIDVENTSSSMSLYLRWRVGGTDSTTTDYQWSYSGLTNGGTPITSNGAGQNFAYCAAYVSTTNTPFVITADITSPFLARETRFYNFGYYRASASTLFGSNSHNGVTSFDGFTIYPSAGTLTGGTITVYGYRK